MTPDMTFTCDATPMAVRRVLGDLRRRLGAADIPDDAAGTIEIALAEALNNIVEHAYQPGAPGPISMTLSAGETCVSCELRDRGMALAEFKPPERAAPDLTGARATLPEGGFGRSLIFALADRVRYQRHDTENRLILDFELAPP